jgi:hypothetical protein
VDNEQLKAEERKINAELRKRHLRARRIRDHREVLGAVGHYVKRDLYAIAVMIPLLILMCVVIFLIEGPWSKDLRLRTLRAPVLFINFR